MKNRITLTSALECIFEPECKILKFNPLPHRDTFNTFANRADPDQAALVRAA